MQDDAVAGRRRGRTSDRLRHEIDRGMGRDKVDFPDPAAAPLGTDSEAGGDAPDRSSASLDEAGGAETRRAEPPSSGAAPHFYVVTTVLTVGVIVIFALAALATAP